MALDISISAPPIFNFGNFEITNSMLVSLGVTLLLSFLAVKFSQQVKSNQSSQLVLFIQTLVESLYEFVRSITPNQAAKFFPLIATIFLFIICANWVGLLPGVETIGILKQVSGEIKFVPLLRGGTADLNITLGLAVFAVISIQFFGYQAKGMKYFRKFLDLTNPINFFVSLLELVSELSRIISFGFRLFGNIFAGEVLLAVIALLIPVFAPLPFIGLEIFIGFIQALVFAMLTLVFINIAVSENH